MPADGLTLPVRVRGKKDSVHLPGRFLQFADDIFSPGDELVLAFKLVFNIDSQLCFRKIPDMTHGSLHDIVFSEIAVDGFCFGGGFDDHQGFWHYNFL